MNHEKTNKNEFNLHYAFNTNAVPNRWNLLKVQQHLAPGKQYMLDYIIWDTYTP